MQAVAYTNPSLALDGPNKIVYRRPGLLGSARSPKVSIVSGGGSGHEPGLAGFVGKGLLTAAVAGTIFASPSAEQVRRAILSRVPLEKGVLVLTLNYTGDVLNFGLAAEKARAAGIDTRFHAMGDDISIGRKKGGKVGRRGIAGTALVVKIAGALAELDGSLDEVYDLARLVSDNLVSIGSALEHVHVPGRGPMGTLMGHGEVEVGMGIHHETGAEKVRVELPELVSIMLTRMLDADDADRHFVSFQKSDQAVLLVNNLGGLSVLELGGIVRETTDQLRKTHGIVPVRILAGTYLSSLNGLGFSLSLLRLQDTGLGDGKSMLELLDLQAEACGWTASISQNTWEANRNSSSTPSSAPSLSQSKAVSNLRLDPAVACAVLRSGLQRVIAAESEVTHFDTVVGDGDCGIGLRRGAEAILDKLTSLAEVEDAAAFLDSIVSVVEDNMDGTSGAIYAIFLNALVASMRSHTGSTSQPAQLNARIWSGLLDSALRDLGRYTPASPGDRTLMDALFPFVETLGASGDVKAAAREARKGAEATKSMKASLGRSVYVGAEDKWIGKSIAILCFLGNCS